MIPLSTHPANSVLSHISQLHTHCNRLLNCFHNNAKASTRDKILCEQTLWNEIKKFRALNDSSIYLYLIGFYHSLLYQTLGCYENLDGHPRATSTTKPPSQRPQHQLEQSSQNDVLRYHVLVRLGDLNRYMDNISAAEFYYCNARNLFPQFGHAYNQLGLLTQPDHHYKCCYFYARAAKSTERPLAAIADSNLRIAVSKYECRLLEHILNNEKCMDDLPEKSKQIDQLPTAALDWFFVIVVAIYSDNILPITKVFLDHMLKTYSKQKNGCSTNMLFSRNSYVLLSSLDIILDWVKLGSQGKKLCAMFVVELRSLKLSLQNMQSNVIPLVTGEHMGGNSGAATKSPPSSKICTDIAQANVSSDTHNFRGLSSGSSDLSSILHDLTFTSSCSSSGTADSPLCSRGKSTVSDTKALPHDYVLRGFAPFKSVHEELEFDSQLENGSTMLLDQTGLVDAALLMQLVRRLLRKLESLGPLIRKKTRNIALESILSKATATTNDQ